MTGVAIVGMACMFPGARDLDAYWRNILGKVDAVSDPPPEAWDPAAYYDPAFEDEDKVYCRRGGYLGPLLDFDPLEHGIPPVAVGGEPDQWIALRIASAALADAGCEDLSDDVRARTGIVLGKGTYLNGGNALAVQRGLIVEQTVDVVRRLHPEHGEEQLARLRAALKAALPPIGAERVPGLIPNIVVGRIANRLDLMGPTYTVDAACASSLVALQQARRLLLDGDCDVVLAGGSQIWMPVPTLNLFCQLGALSRRERIRPFDAEADGTLLGEGIGMVVLKRLADARSAGDRIYAVVRGVGVASDGRGASVMAPRTEGEALALQRAYDEAGVSPGGVGLIEAHGTATPVGDVVEIEALARVFGGRDNLPHCAIGSVKSMISHTIPAAGIAGVIKTALALHQRVLPPTLHCEQPNPKLGLERTPFYVNTETRPWIHGGAEPRRAGVNAFGFGGINAHAILEETPDEGTDHLPPWDSELCVLEAATAEGLIERARGLLDCDAPLTDVAFTLARGLGRVERPVRLAIVASSPADLRAKLKTALGKLERPGTRRIKGVSGIYYAAAPLARTGSVIMLFPGEGAQYPNMLADLCLHFPEVRAAFDHVDRIYAGHPRGHVASDWIFPRPAVSDGARREADARLMQMDIAVEAVLTGNEAMLSLLRRLGVRADGYLGHSTGEFTAAHAAGVLDLDAEADWAAFSSGLNRCYANAASRDDVPRAALLAVGAGREQAEAIAREAGGELTVAMDNCPHQSVLVGEPEAARRAQAILKREGVIGELLPYDRAVHTPRFAGFAHGLRDVFARTTIRPARAPLYSCTTGGRYPDDPEAIRELLVEHWTHPVQFRRTIEALHGDGARVFVECGPRGNLTAFVEDILRGREFCAVAANVQRRSGITQLNHLMALLSVHDAPVDVGALFAGRGTRELDLDAPPAPAKPGRPKIGLALAWPMLRLDDATVADVRGAGPERPAAEPAAPANGAPAGPQAHPAGGSSAASESVAAAVDGHLATMERFLASYTDVMRGVLTPAAGARTVRLRLDPEQDPLLGDHRIGGSLAVVPLALSLQLMADAAAEPGRLVVGLRAVRAHRWLAFDDGPLDVEIVVRPAGDRVQAELRVGGATAVEAAVVLADDYPQAPPPLALSAGARQSRWAPERLYEDVMFHGPRWRAVRAIEATGGDGARALLETLPAPARALDPVVLDAAGQLVGFWTAEHLERGAVVFPFALDALDLFGPPPARGARATCTAAIALVGDHFVRSDIDVRGDDRAWMRLTGWQDKRFDVPAALRGLVAPNGGRALSAPCAAPGALRMRRLDAAPAPDLELWLRVWSQQVLGTAERARFTDLHAPQRRRLEWLAARTAAKEAVRDVVRERGGSDLPLPEIEIDADADGRPFVRLDGAPAISLAHTDGVAVAVAAPAGTVGVDVERLAPLPPGFADAAFGPEELERLPKERRDEWLVRAWCAKEAVAKALGNGLSSRPKAFRVTAVEPADGRILVRAGDKPLVVDTAVLDDLAVATTQCEGGTSA